jgi:cardiolipin synthase
MNYVKERYFDTIDSANSNLTLDEIKKIDADAGNQSRYIQNYAFCPVYKNVYAQYFPTGEEMYASFIKELGKAEKFIFLEFFIIDEGAMWNETLDILKRKVKEGVEVRVIYDDLGCITTLPYNYKKTLETYGIKCSVFNRFIPVLNSKYNIRDHRKIVVIDGKCAYTGGINIADEYINLIVKYGHWKDTGIMIKGPATYSFTVMFLTVWDYLNGTGEDFRKFKTYEESYEDFDGYIQPYNNNPLNEESLGEDVYLNLINRAKRYVYIATPYLILDNQMQNALSLAAQQGLDVRIVTPHIPDKKYVYTLTRANYKKLLESGVKIFEYTPGFIHSKVVISDDRTGTVGTINFDYRSLYLHFECGVWMYNTKAVAQIKEDFLNIFAQSQSVSLKECTNISLILRVYRSFLRMFASLM